ncbi:diguanylate cyclase [Enterovibrio norvegicus FF-162]|uniref:putative bifunctional diguanylate cyclase/phosphodiesterase n=1 Tax=Enterovibrio norvegicus TaxID=188144 RepID=UPI0002F1AE46|nr:bifunctional diguanylate cyclase/phosphodiesterase [Enterovibrio norvegicus]OEE77320.1 diguanylate cyclase [Enterovibrio norvegicus FF-162]
MQPAMYHTEQTSEQSPYSPRLSSLAAIALVCSLILIFTFTLYHSAQSRQHELQNHMLNVEINRVQRAIEVNLQKEAYFLVWLANTLQNKGKIDDRVWKRTTAGIRSTFPFFAGVYWLDAESTVQWTTPTNFTPYPTNANWEASSSVKLNAMPVLSRLSTSTVHPAPNGRLAIEMLHPVVFDGEIAGHLGASYNIKMMVEAIAAEFLRPGQNLVLSDGARPFIGELPTAAGAMVNTVALNALNGQWQLTVWQSKEAEHTYFSLPILIFIAGIVVTALVAMSLYLLEVNIIGRRAESSMVSMLKEEITQRREAEAQLKFTANHDPQTHLPNRFAMEQYLNRNLRSDHDMVLMCVSLDKFQEINDMYGHLVADQLLFEAAKRFKSVLPPHAILARIRNDQFMVACAGMSQLEAEMQANQLRMCLEEEFYIEDNDILTTCAIGIAYRYNNELLADDMLRHADTAANKAKALGSRKVVAYNQTMQEQLNRKKELERAIRQAINNDELKLHFQPQVDLRTRQIVGVEALVRWESQNGVAISTDVIIQTAEETGLMQRLGHWVVDTALKEFSRMLDERCAPKCIAINVSGHEFQDGYLADYVIRSVNRYDIPASRVQIELTEQVFIENLERNQHILNRLTASGISLAIDDFGTGYSSLAYLKHFPVNTVKIDRGFIKDLPQSKDDLVICQAVVSMANLLQLKVVAEGVETIDQQELLRNIGCNFAQGHFYYEPMSADDLMVVLKKQRAGRLYPAS